MELERQAKILAEERRLAREQALQWTREVKMESDDERERKPKKSKKAKTEGGSGDEASEPKRKRRGKLKKAEEQEDGQALFSDEEGVERPTKKSRGTKKRVVKDEDDADVAVSTRKKQL
jgi:RNA polymerase-associated protein CTR9